jgi:hypothetical protein
MELSETAKELIEAISCGKIPEGSKIESMPCPICHSKKRIMRFKMFCKRFFR